MLFLKLALSSNLPKHKLAQAAGIKTDPHSRGRLQTRFAPRAHRMNSVLNSLRFRWSHGSRKLSCWAVLEQHALVVQFRPRTRKKTTFQKPTGIEAENLNWTDQSCEISIFALSFVQPVQNWRQRVSSARVAFVKRQRDMKSPSNPSSQSTRWQSLGKQT